VKVVIAGGGTAGHVNPAIALAAEFTQDEVAFVGTESGAEADLVPGAGYELETLHVRGFDRARPLTVVPTAARAARALGEARGILRRIRPTVVLGMGGYVSLPVCIAARTMRIPVAIHEQNIVLGLANRVCRPIAARVATSFEETLQAAGAKGVLTGNPVLPAFSSADFAAIRARAIDLFDLDPARKTLLVFGGSQGARRINTAAVGLASEWKEKSDRQVLHITGRSGYEEVMQKVGRPNTGVIYRVVEYAHDMVSAYAAADIALCRGGATTVAELAVAGVPPIIVPYPYHRDRQQELHGRVLERAGAAIVVPDPETTPTRVAHEVDQLLRDDEILARMKKSMLAWARPDAATRLAEVVRSVAG
jgi:UDP-N-acetylglucosamine--N-acetylmuramyl-(pentapeptide) pyrophosphoryl-undecaprenol N-acetylglucosamine transferase